MRANMAGSAACIAEIDRVGDAADSALHSWAYWQFKWFHDITTVSGPIEGFYTAAGDLQTAKVLHASSSGIVQGAVPMPMPMPPLAGRHTPTPLLLTALLAARCCPGGCAAGNVAGCRP